MSDAGYTESEADAIKKDVAFYENLRSEVKLHSGDAIDLKQYEPAMRHLVHQEQDQQRPHAVEAQPLPHLDEEQCRDARRVAEDRAAGHGTQVDSCSLVSAAVLRLSSAANRMPPSYSRYIGTAIAVCDSTSGTAPCARIRP